MTNPFASRLAAIGAPLGTRFNGEPVTVTTDTGTAIRNVKFIVDIDETTSVSEGFVIVTGRITCETKNVARFITPRGTVKTATTRGFDWHIYEQGSDEFGLTTFNIRRKMGESEYSNLYDINDQQAVWSS
jgi:hypothetical protein